MKNLTMNKVEKNIPNQLAKCKTKSHLKRMCRPLTKKQSNDETSIDFNKNEAEACEYFANLADCSGDYAIENLLKMVIRSITMGRALERGGIYGQISKIKHQLRKSGVSYREALLIAFYEYEDIIFALVKKFSKDKNET